MPSSIPSLDAKKFLSGLHCDELVDDCELCAGSYPVDGIRWQVWYFALDKRCVERRSHKDFAAEFQFIVGIK